MWGVFGFWIGSAVVFFGLALILGLFVMPAKSWFGILVDSRGRCSLTHVQLFLWSVVILSLISGVFFGRWIHGESNPLGFTIPGQVLGLLGISLGSAATATALKATKDLTSAPNIAASDVDVDPPRLGQIFLLEEGQYADKAIDIGKYQNFIVTLVLVVAYVGLSIHAIVKQGGAIGALPSFAGTFLVLVGISQAGYVANKLPSQAGTPAGLTVENRADPNAVIEPRNPRALIRHAQIARRAFAISQSPSAGDALANWRQAERQMKPRIFSWRRRGA